MHSLICSFLSHSIVTHTNLTTRPQQLWRVELPSECYKELQEPRNVKVHKVVQGCHHPAWPVENTICRTREYPGNSVAVGTPSLCDKRCMSAATTASAMSDMTCARQSITALVSLHSDACLHCILHAERQRMHRKVRVRNFKHVAVWLTCAFALLEPNADSASRISRTCSLGLNSMAKTPPRLRSPTSTPVNGSPNLCQGV